MTKEHVLVTGGAGFIGSAIIAKLQHEGYKVSVIDDLSFGNRSFIDVADDSFFFHSILDRKAVFQTLEQVKPDWVVHLAAVHFIPYCNQHPFESANINIKGTQNILDAIEANGKSVSKLFFASTAAVYPIMDGPLNESIEPLPSDIYGLSKFTGELQVQRFHLRTNVPSIICRFFNAFGPNETNPHLIPEIQAQINGGNRLLRLGNLEPKRDFIHTHDMANAALGLLQKFREGYDTFNLGRGIEYSVQEIVEAFERQLGEKITIEIDPNRIRKVDRGHLLADISKITAFTGWKPAISIDEGISTLIGVL